MRKRIIAFYDVLLFAIICIPMIVTAAILLSMLVTKGTSEWIYENWYLVLIFAITFMVPIGGLQMFRYCVINNSVHFHYFPFTTSWNKAANNIDVRWNQDVAISEIKNIEIVKLTEEEKQTIHNATSTPTDDCPAMSKEELTEFRPWYAKSKKTITINLDKSVIAYFKELSEETGISYQNLINMFLLQCAKEKKKPVFA